MISVLRIATRNSPLALWQARYVANALVKVHPQCEISLLTMTTSGDRQLETSLSKIGGKGLFVKELEQGLLESRADIAVHSMKDVPAGFPEGLHLPVMLPRGNPYDAVVSNVCKNLDDLAPGAKVGTSSLRRASQLRCRYPELEFVGLRGNVNTRLAKLDNGEYDAIILAAAGLIRLKMTDRITAQIPPETCLPAVGQGALGIECRQGDSAVEELIKKINDPDTADAVHAERALSATLGGSCQVPIAGFAQLHENQLSLRALVASVDGKRVITSRLSADRSEAVALGVRAAQDLINQGAAEILSELGIVPLSLEEEK